MIRLSITPQLFLFSLFLCSLDGYSQTDTISKNVDIEGIVVEGKNRVRNLDHVDFVPTRYQRLHSHSGTELLQNMMIPGIRIDDEQSCVSALAGNVSLYINHREASFREIQTIRPKDIVRVEYYDMPTGKYAKDYKSIVFIVRNPNYGGYTQVEGLCGLGYQKSNLSIVSKYSVNHYHMNLWLGAKNQNPKNTQLRQEVFRFEHPIEKQSVTGYDDHRNSDKHAVFSLSKMTQGMNFMIRLGVENKYNLQKVKNGEVIVSGSQTVPATLLVDDNTWKPFVFLYYGKNSSKSSFDMVFDSYYSRNTYYRDYSEGMRYLSHVGEDYLYSKFNTNYSILLSNSNQFTFSLHEYLRRSRDNYQGNSTLKQNLQSSETIFFMDYDKAWAKKFMLDVNPGISFMSYRLNDNGVNNRLSPRLQTSFSWKINAKNSLRTFFSLGNTFPNLNYMNQAEQFCDGILVRRGNPLLKNSVLLGPALDYSMDTKKYSLLFSYYYVYLNHAVVNTYHIEKDHVINSFSSDARSYKQEASLSMTWSPVPSFSVKGDGGFYNESISGDLHNIISDWFLDVNANLYLGNFSFSAFANRPRKQLQDYNLLLKQRLQYGLSAEWSDDNLSVVLQSKNFFSNANYRTSSLFSPCYEMCENSKNATDHSFVSVRFVYSIDYGKKTRHSSKYEGKDVESGILKI